MFTSCGHTFSKSWINKTMKKKPWVFTPFPLFHHPPATHWAPNPDATPKARRHDGGTLQGGLRGVIPNLNSSVYGILYPSIYHTPWEPTTFIFRGCNPYFGGLKPSFFMVLGSKRYLSYIYIRQVGGISHPEIGQNWPYFGNDRLHITPPKAEKRVNWFVFSYFVARMLVPFR